ncbi:MAG: hypothetical protein IPM25_15140 [Chloracidobacterium sp.]|nr:hypothetical protein [Chloracidobacterium sp.]
MERLEDLLEEPERLHFYDLLGGLADNLLTIGGRAGTFLACHACGKTFSTKEEAWRCEGCGQAFELKFKPTQDTSMPFEGMVRVSGLTKSRLNPHWYFENENWSVAEFLTQIFRLAPEQFLRPWLNSFGVEIRNGELETILCWPRFQFGGKTVQPDFAIGFENDIVLFEFKRPSGGLVPPVEMAGQFCFATYAASTLGRDWHLVVVPGPTGEATSAKTLAVSMLDGLAEARLKWKIPRELETLISGVNASALENRITAIGWNQLIEHSIATAKSNCAASWSTHQAIAKLEYWKSRRRALGLL